MSFVTPPQTPTKGRLSASSLEGSSFLLSPGGGRRSGGGGGVPAGGATPPMARASGRLSGTMRSTPTGLESPFGTGAAAPLRTPDRAAGPLTASARDRFIPDRDLTAPSLSNDRGRYLLDGGKENGATPRAAAAGGTPRSSLKLSPASSPVHAEPYAAALTQRMIDAEADEAPTLGVLSFGGSSNLQRPSQSESYRYEHSRAVVYHDNRRRNFVSRNFRVIPQTPERILDAPELVDDFYLNLLDWSAANVLAVALGNALYLWNAATGDIKQLMSGDARSNIITGVSWSRDGSMLGVGMQDNSVGIYDPETSQMQVTFNDHTHRVGALSWNGNVLATGSRDTTIRLYDVRAKNCIGMYQGHTQEVCGLRWSPNGTQLASGGNDNLMHVWDFNRQSRECTPSLVVTQHCAAVKAIAWNPVHHNILASGGGTADKSLKFWNVAAGELINSVDTRSQVCGAVWNADGTEIVTSHGYSDNQLTIWKYPSLTKVADLTGHSSRVLHLAASPDGEKVVSAAGDETIRFWHCFAKPERPKSSALEDAPLNTVDSSTTSPAARQSGRVRPRSADPGLEFELDTLR